MIAEATDLDGNHVILRRGYYDAKNDKGFGWDKAYRKHGVINPNVFKDLISHSRPVRQPDGTLRYDVPINRTHYTSGPARNCQLPRHRRESDNEDCGRPRVGRPDVPDGGQKGVITMYPLPGGGLVEVKPGWTLTPPWVNHNVPIN
ncbi:MAG TPA: hypothetical protein VFA16_08295 [Mycobacterium sp.]|uniref:hypothetical protein n=1 Tax=Mycobacterium sp. TaxID=1785 RepID=UPI002D70B0DD|nr:hypothetical protein [Mycobacterium sp.]HZU47237.1 hypothetical protein [Mycobacterium sp.]